MPLVHFGHPHNTRIGKRHRPIAVLVLQPLENRNMVLDVKRDLQRAVCQ